MAIEGEYKEYIGIMEKKMETTIKAYYSCYSFRFVFATCFSKIAQALFTFHVLQMLSMRTPVDCRLKARSQPMHVEEQKTLTLNRVILWFYWNYIGIMENWNGNYYKGLYLLGCSKGCT